MPEYEFSYEPDLGNPDTNSVMVTIRAQLNDAEVEHLRQRLEAAYKRGWDDMYFKFPLAGFPYSICDNPYSKENFAKMLEVQNEKNDDDQGQDHPRL